LGFGCLFEGKKRATHVFEAKPVALVCDGLVNALKLFFQLKNVQLRTYRAVSAVKQKNPNPVSSRTSHCSRRRRISPRNVSVKTPTCDTINGVGGGGGATIVCSTEGKT
jgi:hypothetical protein